ncbi:MAG TPA: MBL fold metallo-hydrolase, partial [Syntrophorhabdaceae bacterium]|nr:MBL fold metallo-hydrolase [Syntrophorhabdaceae bacterium]
NLNMPDTPGFRQNATISPAAQNGWLTGDVTKGVDSVVAVADLVMTNGKENVVALSAPATVSLKLPDSYASGRMVDYYYFDIMLNGWTKKGTAKVNADKQIDMKVTHTGHWGVVTFSDYVPPGAPGNGFVPAGTYTASISIPDVPSFNKVTFLIDKKTLTVSGYQDSNGKAVTAFSGGVISGPAITPVSAGSEIYNFSATIDAGTIGNTAVGPITFTGTIDSKTGILKGTYSCMSPAVSNAPFRAVNGYLASVANAKAYAGNNMVLNVNLRCQLESSGGRFIPLGLNDKEVQEPMWIFDNLAMVGTGWVKAFVLKTSAGIVVIDTMNEPKDATNIIIPGMKKLGLDPTQIKYILITHGHFDHYGSAVTLKAQAPGSKVLMSAVDKDFMAATARPNQIQPSVDEFITDGQKLVFGDTTVSAVITPGHTPGCVSFIIPVRDKGVQHMAALLGGNGLPAAPLTDTAKPSFSLRNIATYINSLDYFSAYTQAAGVDVALNAHPFVDNTAGLMRLLKNRKPGGPHPWVIGRDGYMRYEGVTRETAKAYLAITNPIQ